MSFITFGLGGTKSQFLRLGFGSSAAVAQQHVGGGAFWARRPFQPIDAWQAPELVHVEHISRVALRIRASSWQSFVTSTSIPRQWTAQGFVAGSAAAHAFIALRNITRVELPALEAELAALRRGAHVTKAERARLVVLESRIGALWCGFAATARALVDAERMIALGPEQLDALAGRARAMREAKRRAAQDARDAHDIAAAEYAALQIEAWEPSKH